MRGPVPDKPLWLERLPDAIAQLKQTAEPWVDRATLESLLGIGRRRAQQLLAQMPSRRIGASVVASSADVIAYLEAVATGEVLHYERRRRQLLWRRLEKVRQEWSGQPPVLIEVPRSEVRRLQLHDFAALPEGVELAPGAITIRFDNPEQALRKLMALALAIGQNREAFEERVALPSAAKI